MQLPDFYEHGEDRGNETTGRYDFMYFHEDKEFSVGGKRMPLDEFEIVRFPYYGEEFRQLDFDEMRTTPLMLDNFWPLLGGPALHNWSDEALEVVDKEIVPVMVDVFSELTEDEQLKEDISNMKKTQGFLGFDSYVRETNSSLGLNVLGSCACLGVSYPGMLLSDREQMRDGFGEYGLHNADIKAQEVSLYAGIAHLARRQTEIRSK